MENNINFCHNQGEKITRYITCPCFKGRQSMLAINSICWFCRYAEFDLTSYKLPETGICKYPQKQME